MNSLKLPFYRWGNTEELGHFSEITLLVSGWLAPEPTLNHHTQVTGITHLQWLVTGSHCLETTRSLGHFRISVFPGMVDTEQLLCRAGHRTEKLLEGRQCELLSETASTRAWEMLSSWPLLFLSPQICFLVLAPTVEELHLLGRS